MELAEDESVTTTFTLHLFFWELEIILFISSFRRKGLTDSDIWEILVIYTNWNMFII